MQGGRIQTRGMLQGGLLPATLIFAMGAAWVRAEEPGLFGRIFRLGGNSGGNSSSTSGRGLPSSSRTAPLPYGNDSKGPESYAPSAGGTARVGASEGFQPSSSLPGPSTPEISEAPATISPTVKPRARTSPAVTSADPLLTRMALGRSNDGSQFGMFLQVFADGTVIDSDGVHRVSMSEVRPIVEVIQSGELYRVRGHCGSPSTDYIEYVQVMVFERRLGRLMTQSFSYAGNPQGCDAAVRRLHTALENLQAKLSRQPAARSAGETASAAPSSEGSQPPATIELTPTPAGATVASGAEARTSRPLNAGNLPPIPDPGVSSRASNRVIPLTPLTPR